MKMKRYFSALRLCFLPNLFSKEENFFDLLNEPEEFIPKTGFQRVQKLFTLNKYGALQPEFNSAWQLTCFSGIVGLIIGGIKESQTCYDNFVAKNQATRFISPYEARRKVQDVLFINFFSKGIKWGIKTATFAGIFSFTVIVISAYRDKDGIIEYTIGGLLGGVASRLNFGLKAMFSAALIGSFLTTFVGLATVLSSKLFNVSMKDARQMQYDFYIARREKEQKNITLRTDELKKHNLLIFRDEQIQNEKTSGYKEHEEDAVYVVVNPENNSELVTKSVKENISVDTAELKEETK